MLDELAQSRLTSSAHFANRVHVFIREVTLENMCAENCAYEIWADLCTVRWEAVNAGCKKYAHFILLTHIRAHKVSAIFHHNMVFCSAAPMRAVSVHCWCWWVMSTSNRFSIFFFCSHDAIARIYIFIIYICKMQPGNGTLQAKQIKWEQMHRQ